jgi:hypothetical protein
MPSRWQNRALSLDELHIITVPALIGGLGTPSIMDGPPLEPGSDRPADGGVQYGVLARATSGWGVFGQGATGIEGDSTQLGGTGVLGASGFAEGIGVEGDQGGTGSGVYGHALATGVGVFGDTTNGTGVVARSTNGKALDVRGKAVFSRSGQVTIAAGAASKKITLAGVTTASMILATAQQDGTVFVRSAVPASGSFTIHLTGKAPAGGLKVAYFVLN